MFCRIDVYVNLFGFSGCSPSLWIQIGQLVCEFQRYVFSGYWVPTVWENHEDFFFWCRSQNKHNHISQEKDKTTEVIINSNICIFSYNGMKKNLYSIQMHAINLETTQKKNTNKIPQHLKEQRVVLRANCMYVTERLDNISHVSILSQPFSVLILNQLSII